MIDITYADGAGTTTMMADPEQWLTTLADNVSENGTQFLLEMLTANAERELVSFDELAQQAGVDRRVVDGWNRNLGRTVKRVVREVGFLRPEADDGTQQLLEPTWDQPNNQWRYTIPARYRGTLKQVLTAR